MIIPQGHGNPPLSFCCGSTLHSHRDLPHALKHTQISALLFNSTLRADSQWETRTGPQLHVDRGQRGFDFHWKKTRNTREYRWITLSSKVLYKYYINISRKLIDSTTTHDRGQSLVFMLKCGNQKKQQTPSTDSRCELVHIIYWLTLHFESLPRFWLSKWIKYVKKENIKISTFKRVLLSHITHTVSHMMSYGGGRRMRLKLEQGRRRGGGGAEGVPSPTGKI